MRSEAVGRSVYGEGEEGWEDLQLRVVIDGLRDLILVYEWKEFVRKFV